MLLLGWGRRTSRFGLNHLFLFVTITDGDGSGRDEMVQDLCNIIIVLISDIASSFETFQYQMFTMALHFRVMTEFFLFNSHLSFYFQF